LKRGGCRSAPFAIKLTKRSLNLALDVQGFRNSLMAHFDTHQLAY
jgi:enoyl-CoA hydratase